MLYYYKLKKQKYIVRNINLKKNKNMHREKKLKVSSRYPVLQT